MRIWWPTSSCMSLSSGLTSVIIVGSMYFSSSLISPPKKIFPFVPSSSAFKRLKESKHCNASQCLFSLRLTNKERIKAVKRIHSKTGNGLFFPPKTNGKLCVCVCVSVCLSVCLCLCEGEREDSINKRKAETKTLQRISPFFWCNETTLTSICQSRFIGSIKREVSL